MTNPPSIKRPAVPSIRLRRFPWPYQAMLAICSDLDETPDAEMYIEYSRFLNTGNPTRAGRGVSLEVGNTLYFDMAPGALSYWNASDGEREQFRQLIRSGHIDCFHSFGDTANSREAAARNLQELERHDCRLKVWVDHAVAPTNLGADIMLGHGDVPGDTAYHLDLTVAHGVRYVWLGRVTACMGQDVGYSPLTSLQGASGAGPFLNALKDSAKYVRGSLGDRKYGMHSGNRLTRNHTLRDGQQLIEFIRCNPNPLGVSVGDNSPGIASALRPAVLDQLARRGGFSILYTHLGKGLDSKTLVPETTRLAFESLAEFQRRGQILVTTTRRLLDYHQMTRSIAVHADSGTVSITSNGACLEGLSLEGMEEGTECLVDGRRVFPERQDTGSRRASVHSFPWPRLRWPL